MTAPSDILHPPPRFTQGSTMRHVVEVTVTGAVGLVAIFFVDFLSLFYISRLGDDRLTAGVGYATTLLFVAISFNIGMMIAATALVSRRIGAREPAMARQQATSSLTFAFILGMMVSTLIFVLTPWILTKLGAQGLAYDVALRFLYITLPANGLMAMGMTMMGLLRSAGDPHRAMKVTLFGGVVTVIMDPLLIFGFGLGTDGAAIATVIARLIYFGLGYIWVDRIHHLIERPRLAGLRADLAPFLGIAVPGILTNLAMPLANLLFMRIMAQFGEAAIAAAAIIDRLVPLAFGVLFALSGAVGPILGQNLGAHKFDRLRQTLRDALVFATLYSLAAWLLMALLRQPIVDMFGLEGATARYVAFFCLVCGSSWLFVGFAFVANSAFNNLGFPLYSTAFNWGRATIGTLPFAYWGAEYAGVEGAIAAIAIGSFVFGIASVMVAFRAIRGIEAREIARLS